MHGYLLQGNNEQNSWSSMISMTSGMLKLLPLCRLGAAPDTPGDNLLGVPDNVTFPESH